MLLAAPLEVAMLLLAGQGQAWVASSVGYSALPLLPSQRGTRGGLYLRQLARYCCRSTRRFQQQLHCCGRLTL